MKIIYFIIVLLSLSSCTDNLPVFTEYNFELVTMPVAKKVIKGQTIEIRCQLIRDGEYKGAKYSIRYFQPDGKGSLRLNNIKLLPNDLYRLTNETFRLYYKSESTDQQTLDIYIEDNLGQTIHKSFSFTNESEDKE